jgi:outer membrane biosynthesis protein TonB
VSDPVLRRSFGASAAVHALALLWLFLPRGCAFAPPPTIPPPSAPPPPSATARFTLVRRSPPPPAVAPPALPPLPPAGGPGAGQTADSGWPSASLIRPLATDHPGGDLEPGAGHGQGTAAIALPVLPPSGQPLGQAAARSPRHPRLDHEQMLLHTAQEFLNGQIALQLAGPWRSWARTAHATQVAIAITADRAGRVRQASLLTSTGVAELDAALRAWLAQADLVVPPIPPDVSYPFLVLLTGDGEAGPEPDDAPP